MPTLVDPDSRLSNYAVTSTEGTLTISMAGVTITWTAPSDIGYGTALDGTQLNATATFGGKDVAGTFVYNPAAGTVLNAGSGQTLAVTFTPTDTQDYNPASGSVEINVGKAPLTVTADNKGITYGDALPAYTGVLLGVVNKDDITAQYASVATGAAGSYPIVPTLVDPDSRLSNYAVTSTEGTLTISMAGVTITWTAPSDIGYGTALDGTQLNATATFSGKDVAGTFVYNPAAGTVLDAGSGQTLAVTFTPTDTQDYNPASGSVEINVGKAPLTVTADNKGITYGDALPAYTGVLLGVVNKDNITAQYASVATGAAGSYPIVPTLVDPDSRLSNYAVTSTEGTLTISMAGVTITWTAPSDIGYGTALDGTQLNATATFSGKDVAGTFVYNPAAGTVLNAGSGQTLAVTFTPTDTQDYNPASGSVEINVGKAPLTVTASSSTMIAGGTVPTITAGYAGFVNGDSATSLTTAPSCGTTATGLALGTFPTTCSGAADLNYSITYVNGTLTVNPASATITLQSGWNLISLPLSPATALTSKTFVAGVLAQTGGAHAIVEAYSPGPPASWLVTNDSSGKISPTSFNIVPRQGYFLYSDLAGTITVSGTPVPAGALSLTTSWNLVGFPDAPTGGSQVDSWTFLNDLIGESGGTYAAVEEFTVTATGTSWLPAIYSGSKAKGNHFWIQPGQGYFVYTDKPVSWHF